MRVREAAKSTYPYAGINRIRFKGFVSGPRRATPQVISEYVRRFYAAQAPASNDSRKPGLSATPGQVGIEDHADPANQQASRPRHPDFSCPDLQQAVVGHGSQVRQFRGKIAPEMDAKAVLDTGDIEPEVADQALDHRPADPVVATQVSSIASFSSGPGIRDASIWRWTLNRCGRWA